MSALLQSVQALVFALASAAFAHFGVVLKDAPGHEPAPAVRRLAGMAITPASAPCATSRPLARRLART